jgi:hypothetical protein
LGIGTATPDQALHVVGEINATTGFRINNAATLGQYLRGNGTRFVAGGLDASDIVGGIIPPAVLQNSTVYIGTTGIALNRGTGAQTLNGVSIDGNAATATSAGSVPWSGISGHRTLTRDNAGLQGDAGARSGFFETSDPTNYYSGASSWQHLVEARHTNDSNNYAMQIAGSFFDQEFYVRKTNNSATTAWSRMWHSTNDGAGSGLDADLLDGNHASAFYLASNPSGYTTNTGTVTSVTVSAGTGLSGTGTITTSGTITLTNAGVTSNVAGTGISVSAATGAVTITNSSPNATHTGDVTGATALTIAANAVTNTKAADMAVNTIKGRITAGTGDPEDLTATQVRTIINVANGATANTGTVTSVTVSPGTGMSGGGTITTSGTVTLTNAGVTSNVAGTGVTVSAATGASTISIGQAVATTSNVQFQQVGVGITPSGWTNGEIRATDNITAYASSDSRLKENISNITDALTKINQLNGVHFDWTQKYIDARGGEDGYFIRRHDVGIIAQEVEQVLPEVVAVRPDGNLAVRYEKLVPLLIEAIKELKNEVDELKGRII